MAVWDGPQLTTSKPEADKFEENGPLNGTTVLKLTITLSRVRTISTYIAKIALCVYRKICLMTHVI